MTSVLRSNDRRTFVANYNHSSFGFEHSLSKLGIFDAAEIIAMSERLPDPAYYSAADSSVGDGWKRVGERQRSLTQALKTLPETNSLVLLKHCEKDPKYGRLFLHLMEEIIEQVGEPLRGDLDCGRATLVISSPHRVTSYHIDAEVNFLLQVRGRKLLHAFDPNDRTILTESELEAFYGGDWDAARYKKHRQTDARVFTLEPGKGVHLPLHAPHWAQNLDDVSVGVSLNFNIRSGARLAKLYKVNKRLRRAGLVPVAPGISAWQDRLKVGAFVGISHARALVQPRFAKGQLT
jgi:hypothetical protein